MVSRRFITDSALAALARRLRVLGYDVTTMTGDLDEVCRVARREQRIVLTMSVRVPRSCAFAERLVVRREDVAASVREVFVQFQPSSPPFSRCTHCNTLLEAADDPDRLARAPVPPPSGVPVTGQCPECLRCYWNGSHVQRLREWIERAIGTSFPERSAEGGGSTRGSRAIG
jgi:uncharacterized protein with PIN domain